MEFSLYIVLLVIVVLSSRDIQNGKCLCFLSWKIYL